MKCAVMLKPSWPASFSRSVRDKDGKVLTRLTFEPRQPLVLEGAELAAVRGDIGIALVYAATDEYGEPVPKPAADQAKAAKGFTAKPKPKAEKPEAEEAKAAKGDAK